MKSRNLKKLLILNIPYVLFALLGTKLSEAVRLAPGADFSAKALHIADGFSAAFSSCCRVYPIDLRRHCYRRRTAACGRVKGKTQRNSANMEYGTARWGSGRHRRS